MIINYSIKMIITESSKKLRYALISKIHTVDFIYLSSRFYIAKTKCTNWADDWKRGLCFKIHTKSALILKPYLKNPRVRCLQMNAFYWWLYFFGVTRGFFEYVFNLYHYSRMTQNMDMTAIAKIFFSNSIINIKEWY